MEEKEQQILLEEIYDLGKQAMNLPEEMTIEDTLENAIYLEEDVGYKSLPILISDDDVYVNFDEFSSGKKHAIFVHGLSGSGKSTLGHKIAEQYNAAYVEIDVIRY